MKFQNNNWKYKGNDFKPGKRIWDEYENEETGESTTETHEYKKTSNFDNCEHYWKLIDNNSNVQCQHCGLGKRIIWGIEFVKDGKLVDKL